MRPVVPRMRTATGSGGRADTACRLLQCRPDSIVAIRAVPIRTPSVPLPLTLSASG